MPNEEMNDLELIQKSNLYFEKDVPLLDVRKPTLTRLARWSILYAFALILLGFLVKIPNYVKIPFSMQLSEPDKVYQFEHPIEVLKRYVSENEKVTANQKLCKISSPEINSLITEYFDAKLLINKFVAYDSIIAIKNSGINKELLNLYNTEISARHHILQQSDEKNSLEVEALKKAYTVANELHAANTELYDEKVISKKEFKQSEESMIKAKDAWLAKLKQQDLDSTEDKLMMSENQSKMRQTTLEVSKLLNDLNSKSINLRNSLNLIEQRITLDYGICHIDRDGLILLAKTDGIVSYFNDGILELNAGEVLMRLRTNGSKYQAFSYINSELIGKITVGNEAKLIFPSYPYYNWGNITAKVNLVSTASNEQGKYRVLLIIYNWGKLKNKMISGLDGEASILYEEKTLFEYMFKQLLEKRRRYFD